MDKESAYRKAKEYLKIARDVIPIRKAVLFGSYADGTPEPHSDIDIGLFVDHVDDDKYWDILTELFCCGRKVDILIEPHLFIRNEDRSGFGEHVEKTGVVIE